MFPKIHDSIRQTMPFILFCFFLRTVLLFCVYVTGGSMHTPRRMCGGPRTTLWHLFSPSTLTWALGSTQVLRLAGQVFLLTKSSCCLHRTMWGDPVSNSTKNTLKKQWCFGENLLSRLDEHSNQRKGNAWKARVWQTLLEKWRIKREK